MWQAECLVETQSNVYERFLSGMMEKDKKQDDKLELLNDDHDDDNEDGLGESLFVSCFILSRQKYYCLLCVNSILPLCTLAYGYELRYFRKFILCCGA